MGSEGRARRGGREGAVAVLGAVWVREGCGWAVSACGCWGRLGAGGGGGGGGGDGGGWRRWSCWGSNKTLSFIFWRSFLISWRKGRHVGGESGGHGSMWAVGVREGCGWAVGAGGRAGAAIRDYSLSFGGA